MADLADPTGSEEASTPAPSFGGGASHRPPRNDGGAGGRYADEIHSITIRARQRTFYLDLKESGNGKFFKLSEKSRGGRKTTIMFDVEDLPEIIKALQEMQTKV